MGDENGSGHEGSHEEKGFKQGVFLVVLAGIVVLAVLLAQNLEFVSRNILPIAALLAILYAVGRFDFLLRLSEYERAVISRFGKVNRVGGPGWAFLLQPLESYRIVDLRAKTLDIPPQEVITKDNLKVTIDAVIYLKVNEDNQSVINSVIEIDDFVNASKLFVIGLIRNQAGTKTLDELITNVGSLNEYLKKELESLSKRWGVTVEEATITEIAPSSDVQEAREQQQIASQKKLARIESAEAHKAEIDAVRQAAGQLSNKALSYYYIKALEKLGEGQSSKIIFPMELTELASSISGKDIEGPDLEALLKKFAPVVKRLARAPAGKKNRQGRKKKRG